MNDNNKKRIATLIEFSGIILFFLIYKFAPQEYSLRAAAGFLLVFSFFQVGYFIVNKLKIPRSMLFINGLSIIFAIPTIIFNDFQFIRIKLLIIKGIFLALPLAFLLFGKNFLYVAFGDLHGLKVMNKKQFDIVNLWFLVTSAIGFAMTLYGYFYLSDYAFITLKTFYLPVIGMIYIIPVMYYVGKAEKDKMETKYSKD